MKFSILITTYNYDKYINECVASCLAQSYPSDKFEVIVVDDGSTDSTQHLMSKFSNKNFFYHRINNSGVEAASNYALSLSRGRYILRVDADDLIRKDYLKIHDQYISDKFSFFYSDYSVIDSEGRILYDMSLPHFDASEIISRGDFLATGTIFDRKIFEKLNFYYDESNPNCGLENFDLMLRILLNGFRGLHLSSNLFEYRRHGLNISEVKKSAIISHGQYLMSKYYGRAFTTNSNHPYGLIV